MSQDQDPVVGYRLVPSTWHRVKMVLLGLLMTGTSYAVVLINDPPGSYVIGWVGTVFFGGCLLVACWWLISRLPRVEIDEQGAYLKTSLADGLRLEWYEIESVGEERFLNQPMINIQPKPEVAWTARLSLMARMLNQLNRLLGIRGVMLSRATLGNQYDTVLAALRAGHAGSRSSVSSAEQP